MGFGLLIAEIELHLGCLLLDERYESQFQGVFFATALVVGNTLGQVCQFLLAIDLDGFQRAA